MAEILVPVSPGELVDKITILALKADRIADAAKLANVRHELTILTDLANSVLPRSDTLDGLWRDLHQINADLWVIEDDIRACDARGDFGPEFVRLARAVYQTNDARAAVKKQINLHLGSAIIEEKSYQDHGGARS